MSSNAQDVRSSFAEQSQLCAKFGSPFTAMLIDVIGRNITPSTSTGRRILEWTGSPSASGDALALRIAGGLHALSNSGLSETLTAVYPPSNQVTPHELWSVLETVLAEFDDWLLPWLDHAPQTNEVARAGVLYPALLEIQEHTGLPISLYEIGASAGLNLILDGFSYHFSGIARGNDRSRVQIEPDWTGSIPSDVALNIESRVGCDLAPIELSDPVQRSRLLAYVWPDQTDRYSRLQAAISLFGEMVPQPVVEKADAADWVQRVITSELAEGRTTVLMNSLVFCYLPDESKRGIVDHMESVGAGATVERPLAWLSFEFDEASQIEATVRFWPGGRIVKLAVPDAHARTVHWVARI